MCISMCVSKCAVLWDLDKWIAGPKWLAVMHVPVIYVCGISIGRILWNLDKWTANPKCWSDFRLQGAPQPLEKEIDETLDSKREDRFSNPFFELVQKTCQVRFWYLLRHGIACKGPRTLRRFPHRCQKIARCQECAVNGFRPLIASTPGSSPPERRGQDQISRVTHGLTQFAPVAALLVHCLVVSLSCARQRAWQSTSKHLKTLEKGFQVHP